MKAEVRGASHLSLPNPSILGRPQPPPPPLSAASTPLSLGSLDASCIEKLLLHCSAALESNDTTLAQQVMWVLHNVAASDGGPNQRLASWFLKALVARASRVFPNIVVSSTRSSQPMTVTELAGYVDLTPWHRFGFSASNGMILRAVEGRNRIHIVDFGISHCMQWPTLIDALAKRPGGPPSLLRLTVPATRPPVPPNLNVSAKAVGHRLANFARSREIAFEFCVLKSTTGTSSYLQELASGVLITSSSLNLDDHEALVVNCQSWLRYLPSDEKDVFLESIRELNPTIVTIADEDLDLDSPSLTTRILSCFNYFWIPFDALETFLPKESPQRAEYEADIGQKIENVVGFEDERRIERLESGARTAQRAKKAGFVGVQFGEETVREVKELLDEHASGWGMKREEDMLVLTWKGHSSVFTMALVPDGFDQ